MRCRSAPRERTFLVAEQLGLEQVLLQRRAVHLDEVVRRPQRIVMDGAGNQLFTGARFAADQHRRIALRHLAHDAKHLLQGGAATDDAFEVVRFVLLVPEVIELVAEAPEFQRLLDLDLHLLDLERLLHVVEGAVLHGLDRGAHGSERRHQDDGCRGMQRFGRAQDIEPVRAAHLQVADDDVEVAFVELFDGGIPVAGLFRVVAGRAERQREAAPQRVVIVRNQYSTHISSLSHQHILAANHFR